MTSRREIRTAADADLIRNRVEEVHDGWFADDLRIDWIDFVDRVEGSDLDLGEDMLSPAIRRIKKIVRDLRRDA